MEREGGEAEGERGGDVQKEMHMTHTDQINDIIVQSPTVWSEVMLAEGCYFGNSRPLTSPSICVCTNVQTGAESTKPLFGVNL